MTTMTNTEDVRVELPRILVELAAVAGKPGITTAVKVANEALTTIVGRAVATGDTVILEQLSRIGYVTKIEEPPA